MKSYQLKKKGKGFTMIELLIGVAFIAIAGLAVLALYNRMQSSANADETRKQILAVQTGIREQYPNANKTGLNIGTLVTAKKIPEPMVNGAGASNKWGGAVTVAVASVNGGTNNGYAISFADVPSGECNSVVTGLLSNFPEIAVGATTVKDAATTPDSDDIANACDNDTNLVVVRGT